MLGKETEGKRSVSAGRHRRAAKILDLQHGAAPETDKRPADRRGVTGFFSEPEVFGALETTILPRILTAKLDRDPIRVWVPSVSTGEEVYSLAICLTEALPSQSGSRPIQIFGTDLEEETIQIARAGTYPESALLHVSQARLRRCFAKQGGQYCISAAIRQACVFARHDVTKDPPYARLDLISCRGVLDNLEPALQMKVLSTFHYALRETGFLLLGESETPVDRDLFTIVDRKNSIFIKRPGWTKAKYAGAQAALSLPPGEDAKDVEIRRLRVELARTRSYFLAIIDQNASNTGYLQDIIRQQETANEELRSANEEVTSAMEEIQCMNEHLETAREEFKSSNDELITLHEQALNRNSELSKLSDDLTNLLAGVNIPIVMLQGDGRIRCATPSAEALLHVLPSDAGRPMSDIRMGLAIAGLDGLISTVLTEGRQLEREVRGEDGRWYSLRIRPYRTGSGKTDGALLALWNIDTLKESQETARKQEHFVSAILDAAGWALLVVVFDPEGRVVHFNRACQVLTGYSLEEVKGRRGWDFLLAPQEHSGFKAVFRRLVGGATEKHENHWLTKDGHRRLVDWWISVVGNEDGQPQYVIGSGIDVTERQQAREQARHSDATVQALLETAAQAIIGINDTGIVVLANATAEAMFGYPRKEMLGQPIEMLLPARLRPEPLRDWSAFVQKLENRSKGQQIEKAGVRKGGAEFPVEINLSEVATSGGTLSVAFVTDITERRSNEEALRRSEQRLRDLTAGLLEAQEQERRRISRELHDDLNQKLAMLAVELGGLEARLPEPDGAIRAQLRCVEKRLNEVSDDVRRTAYQLHPSVLEHLGLVEALETYCGEFSAQQGLTVTFRRRKLPETIPTGVALCLYRVVQEALHNVAKHSGAARASVILTGMGGGLVLTVEDQGRGFDPTVMEGKRGLGLVSMKERVAAAGGVLTISARPGEGSRVQVQIPLKRESE